MPFAVHQFLRVGNEAFSTLILLERLLCQSAYLSGIVLTVPCTHAFVISAAGYPLTPGQAYSLQYTLAGQMPVTTTSLSSQAGNPYPTYINSQLTPLQIPAQNPYAGHPLYPSNPYAGLQFQQAQVRQGDSHKCSCSDFTRF
ncbi:hypothetical protein DPMN_176383 [Dreissena polymorpha]|uniref:Uncharacterized protein n=1 Tax=Dreissena polymorpha TaxID=45954 RepID=A0A9D4E8Z5_DREPO|nr:hypothetical protein DPMN_176383 [Dreissena polymorpha]